MSTTNTFRCPLQYPANAFAWEDYKDFSGGTNLFRDVVWYFSNAGSGIVHGNFITPLTFDNTQTATFQVAFASPTAGSAGEQVKWDLGYKSYASSDSADPAAVAETATRTEPVNGVGAKTWVFATINFTETNLNSGDFVEFFLKRDSTVGSNHPATVVVGGIWLLGEF